jgi:DNA-binding transcriptional regulator YiaG
VWRDLVAPALFWRGAAASAALARAGRPAARGTSVAAHPGMPENTRNLIRTLRQQLGMTQEEFAHEIAVTVSTVNRWENSHAEPSKLAWKAIRDLAQQRGLKPADQPDDPVY